MTLCKYPISVLLLILSLLYGVVAMAANTENEAREYKLKAAFLLNFSKFSTWPEEAFAGSAQTFDFCIVGEDPFGSALDGLDSKTVGGRPIRLLYAKSIAEAESCHVMFVSKSEQNNLEQLHALNIKMPVMTVSDIKGFSSQGGIFEFITKGERLSFIVNNNLATKNGIHINASLLNLAAEVL